MTRESHGVGANRGATSAAFACALTDADMVRGVAPEQPETVQAGQTWMKCSTGESYPVRSVRDSIIDLGSDYYVIVLTEDALRRDYVCTDPARAVTEIRP